MKKVLVLASTFPRWKNDTTPPFVFELEKRLTKDFEIYVLAPHYKGAKKYEVMENLYVTRFQYFWPASLQKLCYEGGILPNLKKNKLLYFQAFTLLLCELFTAAKLVHQKQITLIHAHWIIPQGIIALLLKKLYKTPYIVTTHGGDIYGLQNPILTKLKKQILENAKAITVVSTAIRDEIHKKINPNLNIQVISMGVDSKLFNPNKYDENLKKKYNITGPFLLFVGRLAEKKGVKYLLEAMPAIIKEFPKVKLLIVGEGTIKEELENLTKKLQINSNTIFVGAIPNQELPKYYATADIFVGPSIQIKGGDTEGLGLTFVEASFSGSIPVGTKVGGIADVIKDQASGILVEQQIPIELSNAIEGLLKNKKLFRDLKQNTRKFTSKIYDWLIVQNAYKKVYLYD